MKRPQHCKGCILFHNAGHPKESKNERFNAWCIGAGKLANKAVGFCKTHGLKKEQTK